MTKEHNYTQVLADTFEMTDFFRVEIVNKQKCINRWGFFAKQEDGTYAIYKPEHPVCRIADIAKIPADESCTIEIVDAQEIHHFLNSVRNEVEGIAMIDLNVCTPCGWYYDTIV